MITYLNNVEVQATWMGITETSDFFRICNDILKDSEKKAFKWCPTWGFGQWLEHVLAIHFWPGNLNISQYKSIGHKFIFGQIMGPLLGICLFTINVLLIISQPNIFPIFPNKSPTIFTIFYHGTLKLVMITFLALKLPSGYLA